MKMKALASYLAGGLLAGALLAGPAAAEETIKVGILHSLSGTMAISETTLKDTARDGQTVKALILQGVEHVLAPAPASSRKVRLPLVPSKRPGALRLDNARIYDVISFP